MAEKIPVPNFAQYPIPAGRCFKLKRDGAAAEMQLCFNGHHHHWRFRVARWRELTELIFAQTRRGDLLLTPADADFLAYTLRCYFGQLGDHHAAIPQADPVAQATAPVRRETKLGRWWRQLRTTLSRIKAPR